MLAIKPAIVAFYRGRGLRLIEAVPFERIVIVDEAMEQQLRELTTLYQEIRALSWRLDTDFRLLVNTFLDFVARPNFPQLRLASEPSRALGVELPA